MSYIALYRKWRPSVFEDVVEQEHVVKTLKYSVNTGRIAHAYLFCGTRGTGKTTMAKIFSRAINCLSPKNGDPCNECAVCKGILNESILDVVEIDAASNNSVDNVREIRDEVVYAPSQAKYKVYIIDEVHMLSTGAFNALLKTLEEPPSHVVFILATTDPHKLPATILSRCQRFDFRRITVESIIERLDRIAADSGIILQKEASRLIARMSDGALRDAISILDQCMSMGNKEISYNDVLLIVGIVNDTFIADVIDAVNDKNINSILELVEKLVLDGKDISKFVSDIVYYYRNLLICKITSKPEEIIEASKETLDRMKSQCTGIDQEIIIHVIKELSSLESSLKWATHPRILLEVSLIKLCEQNFNTEDGNILERLSLLEKRINSGDFAIKSVSQAGAAQRSTPSFSEKGKTPENSAPVPQAKPAAIDLGSAAISDWDAILFKLKSMGRMGPYTNLLGTKAVELDSRTVGIIFSKGSGFNKMFISKHENLEVVETVISGKLGREIKVKCLDESEYTGEGKEEAKPENNEFLDRVQDIAQKHNITLNIIDE